MTEYCSNLKTTGTLNIHEEAIRALHKPFQLVLPCLGFNCWVEKVDWHFELVINLYKGNLSTAFSTKSIQDGSDTFSTCTSVNIVYEF